MVRKGFVVIKLEWSANVRIFGMCARAHMFICARSFLYCVVFFFFPYFFHKGFSQQKKIIETNHTYTYELFRNNKKK